MDDRAYSLLEIKSTNEEERSFEGVASTPTSDHDGDILEPLGAEFALPIVMKWEHGKGAIKDPVGWITEANATPSGIFVKGKVAKVETPESLKNDLDRVWALMKSGLVRGLSVGFRGKQVEPTKTGRRFIKWAWGELSAVAIPANAEATILSVKSVDEAFLRAVPGASATRVVTVMKVIPPPGAAGIHLRGKAMKMTYKEHIAALEATRQANVAAMDELMKGAQEKGDTLDAEAANKFDELKSDVARLDKDLERYRDLDKLNVQKAVEVKPEAGTKPEEATQARTGIISVKSNLPKGTAFTRYCVAIASTKGEWGRAMEYSKQWHDSTPEVELMIKAAVAAGTTTDATWAGPLVVVRPLIDEFLDLLRPRTLIGRIPGLRMVPFNVSVPSMTSGGTYGWVGQGSAKPVTAGAFTTVSLTFAKVAGIVVLTQELVKLSTPSAEATVREMMIAGIIQFLDQQFVDPAVAAVASVSPASITNGAGTAAASGVTGAAARADLSAAVATFTAANIPLDGSVWLMNDSNAFGLGLSLNALGQPLFPGVGTDGGTLLGRPVIVSNSVGNIIVLVHAPSILVADDGGVTVDVSDQATVQMDSAPANPADATTVYVSLWQRNLVGLRAERFITWLRARTGSVRVITAAAYNGT